MKSSRKFKPAMVLLLFTVVLIVLNGITQSFKEVHTNTISIPASGALGSDVLLAEAFNDRKSNIWLSGEGKVKRLLPDDQDGRRHQKFLMALDSGQTLLVAHNIEIAPRIENLHKGDFIEFFGEYEWNEKGGVIHWTHRDPKAQHPGGWIKHNGKIYR